MSNSNANLLFFYILMYVCHFLLFMLSLVMSFTIRYSVTNLKFFPSNFIFLFVLIFSFVFSLFSNFSVSRFFLLSYFVIPLSLSICSISSHLSIHITLIPSKHFFHISHIISFSDLSFVIFVKFSLYIPLTNSHSFVLLISTSDSSCKKDINFFAILFITMAFSSLSCFFSSSSYFIRASIIASLIEILLFSHVHMCFQSSSSFSHLGHIGDSISFTFLLYKIAYVGNSFNKFLILYALSLVSVLFVIFLFTSSRFIIKFRLFFQSYSSL